MRLPIAFAALTLIEVPAIAEDVKASLTLTYFECSTPETKPPCVSPDHASKKKSCPDCGGWRQVTVDTDVTARPKPDYQQPNTFANDMAKQLFGTALPTNSDGKPVSLSHFYKNFERYGWIEVPAGQSTEGTLALLPTTAAVVVDQKPAGDRRVIYSSTKRDGDVHEIDLDVLVSAVGQPKFIVPEAFLATEAGKIPPQ